MYGKRIREIRKNNGLTQEEFSKKTGIPRVTICKYESEFLDLSTKAITAICKAFNVSADYLLGLED